MAVPGDGYLHVYMLSVGQGDTTVVVSPGGSVTIIDAVRPYKVLDLLDQLGNDMYIEHLVVTHPHDDHYGGCNRLAIDKTVLEATMAPFWHEFGMGPPTYRSLVHRLDEKDTRVRFLSGYSRWYPDGTVSVPGPGEDPIVDDDLPFIEFLGPTNSLVRLLEDSDNFNTNHLSIMSRLTWRNFRMIITGDAQMENWAFFDQEGMMEVGCNVLRAAHHGSANGNQWERIDRLDPRQVVVSSDPDSTHHLPDLIGAAIFTRFDGASGYYAALTRSTGTIHLRVSRSGYKRWKMCSDEPAENVDLNDPSKYKTLSEASNPTNWQQLLERRVNPPEDE